MANEPADFIASIHEDLRKSAREADRVDKARLEAFEALVARPEWKVYVDLLDATLGSLGSIVLMPVKGMDGAIALEYQKGTMRGLIMARDLPSITIAQMKSAPDEENSDA